MYKMYKKKHYIVTASNHAVCTTYSKQIAEYIIQLSKIEDKVFDVIKEYGKRAGPMDSLLPAPEQNEKLGTLIVAHSLLELKKLGDI